MSRPNELSDRPLEEFLSEFALRRPRALPAAARSSPWFRAAAAAAVGVSCAASLWLLSRNPGPDPAANPPPPAARLKRDRPSSIALTRLALEDPARLDSELSEASRESLPSFRRADSAVPAKD